MAVTGVETQHRKTKCIGSRKALYSGPWLWCIPVLCFIPCCFSECNGVPNWSVSASPGDVAIPYGSPLETYCVGDNSSDLVVTLGGRRLETEIVNETTIRFYIEKPAKQANTYYCKSIKSNKKCTFKVLVDSPPSKVENFKCISKNLDILNCSWHSPVTFASNNYMLTFYINGQINDCPGISEESSYYNSSKKWFCLMTTTSYPRYRQMEESFNFTLTSSNTFGVIHQQFNINHYEIIKSDPPSEFYVTNITPHSVMLHWTVPINMVQLVPHGITHRIEYQIAKVDNTTYFHRVNADLPSNNQSYRFHLTNLPYAHMKYEVRIYIKSKKASDDLWSDFTFKFFVTASERPRRPPDTTIGAFQQNKFENKRLVYVYWKQLEEYEEAGANFTYKVVVTQNLQKKTLRPDKNKSLSYVVLDKISLGPVYVDIWSENSEGLSDNSSHLYIPPMTDGQAPTPTRFTKLAYENGTYKLLWDGVPNIDNYTLFWCQYNATKICSGRLNFTILSATDNFHVIDLPKDYRYQFAISVNRGTGTSGMVWAKCDISKDAIGMYGFPIELKYDAPTNTSVKLHWIMDCALQDGIITGYSITYCPVIKTSSICDTTVGNNTANINQPNITEINITGLLPYRTYQFTIALNTTYGLKTIENATTALTTAESEPTCPRNIHVSNVRNDSLTISWDPPLQRNGNIKEYVILDNNKELQSVPVPGDDVKTATIKGLTGYRNMSLTVQACNKGINVCCKVDPKDAVAIQTRIGAPGKISSPSIRNNVLKWDPPALKAGLLNMYQIRRVIDDLDEISQITNTTVMELHIDICDGVKERETYQVRAVNFDNETIDNVFVEVMYAGEWSDPNTVTCSGSGGVTIIIIFTAAFLFAGIVYGCIKLYKKHRKMEDIKPVLPNGLGIPEKDISRYPYSSWNPSNKDDKPPSSDEMLLLPNGKSAVSTPDIKQKDNDNCAASDQTDSTGLTDTSRGLVDRQASTSSDDGSTSSLRLEVEQMKRDNIVQEETSSAADSDSSRENSPYFNPKFKKNPGNGYVQSVTTNEKPPSGYVQSTPTFRNPLPPQPSMQPSNSSYVMAGLSQAPAIFTTGVVPPITNHPPLSSGYIRPEDAQTRSMNFPKLGTQSAKMFGPDSLPSMPVLPPSSKHGTDNSYIQLQSMDPLPSLKPTVRNTVPLKPPTSSGYVSPGDAVINKHLNNILSAGQLNEESAILDPTMSPDAYCRFSWSTDPANDNLNSILAESLSSPNN